MYSLFLDHSFSIEVLALFEDDKLIQQILMERSLGDHPCHAWQMMLDTNNLSLSDIAYFVCGTGPGSYTGMRSAAASIKAVSFAQKKPIVATPSLLLLCPKETGSYLLIKDAKIAGFYACTVHINKNSLLCEKPTILPKNFTSPLPLLCELSDAPAKKIGAHSVPLDSEQIAKYAFKAFQNSNLFNATTLPLTYLAQAVHS
jgi:tRNA A37 threonylcarbamoyladenosine modification protein TsaB